MPYINREDRPTVDANITDIVLSLKEIEGNLIDRAGPLNYTITRICTGLIDKVSYRDICVLTGVLENVKQELYRRAAAPYEDMKIYENGDTNEYVRFDRQTS